MKSLELSNKLKLTQRLNHNVVICEDCEHKELIVFGKGIGFNVKESMFISNKDIERIYEINDTNNKANYKNLISDTDEKIILASETVISEMTDAFGKYYNEKIHISLLNHLIFSVKRYNEKIHVGNMFVDEIKFLYPKEFEFSIKMINLINSILNIDLPIDEAGFICMHVHSALNDSDKGLSALTVNIIGECIEFIESEINIKLDEYLVLKQRLITHLKFAIKRSIDKISLENPLEYEIKEKYTDMYLLAKRLKEYIAKEYDIELAESELAYLTIHFQIIVNMAKNT